MCNLTLAGKNLNNSNTSVAGKKKIKKAIFARMQKSLFKLLNFMKELQAFFGFAGATQNVDEFMANHFFNVGASGFKIFSRVELRGIIVEEFSDGSGHCKANIRIDIDFANRKFCRFTELFFGHADSVGHLAAVLVYHLYVFLRNGRRAV